MKLVLQYQCSICGNRHSSFFDAWKCEKKGIPEKDDFPVGLMYEYHMHGKFIGIFSIAETFISDSNGHLLHSCEWAVRNRENCGTSDSNSLGSEMCGGGFLTDIKQYSKFHFVSEWGRKQPEFQKMCEYLSDNGIIPQFYDENGVLHIGNPFKK